MTLTPVTTVTESAGVDLALSAEALGGLRSSQFGIYVHVPFCATRCGYCDFNTYTASELDGSGASQAGWFAAVGTELRMAAEALGAGPEVQTIFVGGGTPSLLGGSGLRRVLDEIRATLPLAAGAEVTTEANPESTSREFFAEIAEAGYTRVSLGMQSAAPGVLAVLDRRHTPGRPSAAAREARAEGISQVSLDLIYGTPGETDQDLRDSLEAVLAAGVDHVSAYALIVEQGTALARRIRRGELAAPDDDVSADRYELVDSTLESAGLHWYEVSNWSTSAETRCRHNMGYWLDGNWWGIGPGAHSHVGGIRWWNAKHPARYAATLAGGRLPVAGREELTAIERYEERVMLGVRLADGLAVSALRPPGREAAGELVADGLLEAAAFATGAIVLTARGRLLADAVVRALLVD
jgi:oxygen-independent coproporphyrinogen-3 oxidase